MHYWLRPGTGAVLVLACCLLSRTASARLVNITTPEDPVQVTVAGALPDAGPELAIDRNPATMFRSSSLVGAGLTITPNAPAIVRAIRLTSGQDSPTCDPSGYSLEASLDGENFVVIAAGAVPAFRGRLCAQTFTVPDSSTFRYFRVTFTGARDTSAAQYISVGEVELLASYDDNSDDPLFAATSSEIFAAAGGVDFAAWPAGPGSAAPSGGSPGGSSAIAGYIPGPYLQPLTSDPPTRIHVVPEPTGLAGAAVPLLYLLRRRRPATRN